MTIERTAKQPLTCRICKLFSLTLQEEVLGELKSTGLSSYWIT